MRFQNDGIYLPLANGEPSVDIADYKEAMGSLRILKSALDDGLNSYVGTRRNSSTAILKDGIVAGDLRPYAERVNNYLSLCNVKTIVRFSEDRVATYDLTDEDLATEDAIPYNRIIYGAPGTGKSFLLDKQKELLHSRNELYFPDELCERVTFYPDYTHAMFFSVYKPVVERTDGNPTQERVTYRTVPGPLLRMIIKAHQNPDKKCLLIIEEINRANVAAVFGEIFQLLDRRPDGTSQYSVSVSEDQFAYLQENAPGLVGEDMQLSLPSNLYLWATMNSADQGVYPIDTAFKRRWSFEYLPIDYGEDALDAYRVRLPYGATLGWNDLRRAINRNLLAGGLGITEDKLIGPFFLSARDLAPERFVTAFRDKVLMYLFEDVLKRRHGGFFRSEYHSFSSLRSAYDNGERVFDFTIDEEQFETAEVTDTAAVEPEAEDE